MNFDAEKKNTEIKYFGENEEQMCMGQRKKPSMCNSIKVNPFFLQKSNDRQRITDRLTDQVNYILDAYW